MSGGMGGGEAGVPDDLLTTKGDTHGFDTSNARVGIGADSTVLTADSVQALGLKWAAIPSSEGDTSIVGTCNFNKKSHFFEDFTYKDVSQAGFTSLWGYWNTSDATVQINATGGGLSVLNATGGRVYTQAGVSFGANAAADAGTNSILPFSNTGSVLITALTWTNSNIPNTSAFGLTGAVARSDAAGNDSAIFVNSNSLANLTARTVNNAGAQNDTSTGLARFTNGQEIELKIECKASSIEFTVDGALVATSTSNLPTTNMGVVYGVQNNSASSAPGKFTLNWIEGYNT